MSRIAQITRPARLTSSLLVRKGEARPAGHLARSLAYEAVPVNACSDRGGPPATSLVELPHQQEQRARGDDAPALADTSPPPRPDAAGPADRFVTTVRLDAVRHYRLRLFAARQRIAIPDLISKALDAYLDAHAGDCACLRRGPGGSTC